MKLSYLFIACFLLSGCSSLINMQSRSDLKKERKQKQMEAELSKRQAYRTPGSLWSKESTWNELYTLQAIRRTGDIIFIRPTAQFKKLVSRGSKKPGNANASTQQSNLTSPQGRAVDNGILAAKLEKKLGREIYVISSNQIMDLGETEEEIKLTGKIREKDLDKNDFVSSDMIFDMTLDVNTYAKTENEKEDEEKERKKIEKERQKERKKRRRKS